MNVEIDQSGKIEHSNRLTVIAYANNGKSKSLLISGPEKQLLLTLARQLDWPQKTFIFKIFAALIFVLIKDDLLTSVTIDHEYPGHEGTIKNVLLSLFEKAHTKPPVIRFGHIGKVSPAHVVAIDVFRRTRKADYIVTAKEVLQLLYLDTKKDWRFLSVQK